MSTLNELGQKEIKEWVERFGIPGLNIDAFYSDAEAAFDESETSIIEIGSIQSADGYPVTLTLENEWFEVR